MSTIKFDNGKYKTTSKAQEDTCQKLFKGFYKVNPGILSMGRQFNQYLGTLELFFYLNDTVLLCSLELNRAGKIQ